MCITYSTESPVHVIINYVIQKAEIMIQILIKCTVVVTLH